MRLGRVWRETFGLLKGFSSLSGSQIGLVDRDGVALGVLTEGEPGDAGIVDRALGKIGRDGEVVEFGHCRILLLLRGAQQAPGAGGGPRYAAGVPMMVTLHQ